MTAQSTKKDLARLMLCLLLPVFLSACSEPGKVEPAPTVPAQYELTDLRYFLQPEDRVDTTIIHLKKLRVQNSSNTLATQQIQAGFGELMKTSQFEVDPTNVLPKNVDLSAFEVRVPERWYSNGTFDYSAERFPFRAAPQQKPYGTYTEQILTVRVPPKAAIDITRQVEAYHLSCSFQGILENTTTGQRYPVRGKWNGLLQYDHPATTLTQSPL